MNRLTQQIGRRTALHAASAGAVGVGLGLGGIRGGRAAPLSRAQEATPTAGDGNPPGITPERVDAAVALLDDLAQQTLDGPGIPGLAISVVYGDDVPYMKGFGVREAGQEAPVDAEPVFHMASLSKPISSSVVAGVVGDGVASWDSRISDLQLDFQMMAPWVTSQITLRDMFCHRSGLPDHGGDLLEDLGFDRAAVLHRLRYIEPNSSFRSHYAYTNFGLTAAATAVYLLPGEDLGGERAGPAPRPGADHLSPDPLRPRHLLVSTDWRERLRPQRRHLHPRPHRHGRQRDHRPAE